jgi:Xaa-Pro dipeptidase
MTAAERIERLRAATTAAGLDACVVTSDESIAYLTGFRPLQLERLFAVVVPAEGEGAIVVPRLDQGQLEDAPQALARVAYDASSDGIPELTRALASARRIGVEEDHIVFARSQALAARGLELRPAGSVVMGLRMRKDDREIEAVRQACALVEAALSRAFDELRPGAVERAVTARVESWLREQGATAAHALILFGADAANPHREPGPHALARGDGVCADVSACLDGYWGDLTRCATVGPASEWARAAWGVVRDAQAAAIAVCLPGTPARDVDLAQRRIVESRGDLGACLHGAGHAIGLGIHESPFLIPRTDTPLQDGMIFTIEPGLYQPGVGGIRLEDDVVVRPGAPEVLSTLPLDLIEIPA